MKKLLTSIALVTLGFAVGYYAARHSLGLPGTMKAGGSAPVPEQSGPQAGMKLGPWAASFHIPGSVEMPEGSPVIRCEFPKKSADVILGFTRVTIFNLDSKPYRVRYYIYGYDAKGRRISDGEDEFAIGRHESVVRRVLLNSHAGQFGPIGQIGTIAQTFWVQMTLEE